MDGLDSNSFSLFLEFLLYLLPDARIESTLQDILDIGDVIYTPHQRGRLSGTGNGIDDAISSTVRHEIIDGSLGECWFECHFIQSLTYRLLSNGS